MLRLPHMTYTVLLTVLLSAQLVHAADRREPVKQGLNPEKIQQIQSVGQSILVAKKKAPANPDMDQLRQRVDELRQAVSKLHGRMLQPVLGEIKIMGENAPEAQPMLQPEEAKVRREREQAESDVRNVLTRVRQQRTVVRQKLHEKKSEESRHMEGKVLAKIQELEDELENALQSAPNERVAKLRALEGRLTIKPRTLEIPDKDKTPTISTIVRHRTE